MTYKGQLGKGVLWAEGEDHKRYASMIARRMTMMTENQSDCYVDRGRRLTRLLPTQLSEN